MRTGVVDVGTNSVRVLIADVRHGVVQPLHRDLTITRLGEGVDAARTLATEPMERTVDAIARYVGLCRDAAVERLRIAATSAVRDASNRDEFAQMVREVTGAPLDVVAGDEEARLGFLGATGELRGGAPYLVCDIGGGSTELVYGGEAAQRWISLDIGSVRLTERHVRSDPPRDDEREAVRRDADEHLARAEPVVRPSEARTLVGLAGTITTVAAVALGLPGYDRDRIHHARLGREQIGEIAERLAAMTSEQRRALPAMPRGREDVIVAGVCILEQVMDRFGFAECLVSESDILDGLALSLAP